MYLWCYKISIWFFGISIFGALRYLSLAIWDIYMYIWCYEMSTVSDSLGYLSLVIWDICLWFNGISILSSIPATVGYLFMEWEPVNSNCFCKWTIQTSRVIPQDRQGSCELALNQMRGTGGWNTSLEGQIWQTRLSDIVYHYLWSCIKL